MATTRVIFQNNVFQDNAFKTVELTAYTFQRNIFQGKNLSLNFFQPNIFQDNIFSSTYVINSVFDVNPILVKILDETLSFVD